VKVLLVNTLYAPHRVGGAERSVQSLAETLVAGGHSVAVATLHPERKDKVATINGVEVHYFHLSNVYWPYGPSKPALLKPLYHALDTYNPFMARRVAALATKLGSDIVHTNNLGGFSPAVWAEVARLGLPLVHTARDYHMMCPRTHMFRRGRVCESRCVTCRVYAEPREWLSHHVNTFVAISRSVEEQHRAEGFFRSTRETAVIGSSYEAPANALAGREPVKPYVRFSFAGRLAPEKGIELLAATMARMDPARARLVIAGTGSPDYVASLRSRFAGPAVEFAGAMDIEQLLAKTDVMVVPSLWREPFGRTAVEALAHGIPVVASKRGGLSELVTDDVTGWRFDPDNAASLGRVVDVVLARRSELSEMRDACIGSVQRFRPRAIADQYQQLYARAIERRRR
jgi:glycosyltransferase involved in cell wall biosynthesis